MSTADDDFDIIHGALAAARDHVEETGEQSHVFGFVDRELKDDEEYCTNAWATLATVVFHVDVVDGRCHACRRRE